MASASERRSQRELAEARASGNAPPEVDVKTGAMINPHNPEFITKKPWYLAEGGDGGGMGGGPTLDHQADQRREEDKRGISLAEADRLVREERQRIKDKLEIQKQLQERSKKKMIGFGSLVGPLSHSVLYLSEYFFNTRPQAISERTSYHGV